MTPWSRDNPIATWVAAVAELLDHRFGVAVFHPDTADPISTTVPTYELPTHLFGPSELASFDFVVYSLGDRGSHDAIHAASSRVPGVVVLHDLALHASFADLWLAEGGPEGYFELLERWTDAKVAAAARRSQATTSPFAWTPYAAGSAPLFEPAISSAHGVIAVSDADAVRVRERFVGPVEVVPVGAPEHAADRIADFLENHVAFERPVLALADDLSRAIERIGASGDAVILRRATAWADALYFDVNPRATGMGGVAEPGRPRPVGT